MNGNIDSYVEKQKTTNKKPGAYAHLGIIHSVEDLRKTLDRLVKQREMLLRSNCRELCEGISIAIAEHERMLTQSLG